MAFLLAAANGTPFVFSSSPYCAVFSVVLLATRNPRITIAKAFGGPARGITIGLGGFALSIAIGVAFLPNLNTGEALLNRALVPMLIYFALVGVPMDPRGFKRIMTAFIVGVAVALARGLLAFYGSWGIPDAMTLLWARYDVIRMDPYMTATFGNVGHMGAYLALVVPPILLYYTCFVRKLSAEGLLIGIALAMGALNLVISGARTGIVTVALSIMVVLVRLGIKGGAWMASILILFGAIVTLQGFSDIGQSDLLMRFVPAATAVGVDESAVERYMSISEGWASFKENPILGIGPGMSPYVNSFAVPHQSVVFVASELGLVGAAIFLFLNIVVFKRAAEASLAPSRRGLSEWRLLWYIGPACWLFFGFIGGFTFNRTFALLWIGITHMMLAFATSTMVPSATIGKRQ
jgi:O-antigen ligase